MKLITGFLKFIGTLTLMISLFFYLLNTLDWSVIMFLISIACFAVAALLKLYLFYHLYFMKKDNQDFA